MCARRLTWVRPTTSSRESPCVVRRPSRCPPPPQPSLLTADGWPASHTTGRSGGGHHHGTTTLAPVRFATFNASLNRTRAGQLVEDLSTPDNAQARNVAETIQRVDPDVVLVNEFDYDPAAVDLFRDNYLEVGQNGADRSTTPTPTSRRPTPASRAASTSTTTAPWVAATTPSASASTPGSTAWSSTRSTRSTPAGPHLPEVPVGRHAGRDAARRPRDGRSRPTGTRPTSSPTSGSPPSRTGTCRSGSGARPCTSWSPTRRRRSSTDPRTATAPATSTRSGFWADYVSGGHRARYIYDDDGHRGGLHPRRDVRDRR